MKEIKYGFPGLFLRFFRWFCRPELRDFIEGDLREIYAERVKEKSRKYADRHFIIDVLQLFRPGIIKPIKGFEGFNNLSMVKNYFRIGIRNHIKYKAFSFINVFGLAIAMTVSMLIILMLADQQRYDSFQKNKDLIYRILMKPADATSEYASGPFSLANALKMQYPFVKDAVCLYRAVGGDLSWNQHFAEARGYFTDDSFFNIFSFGLQKGNRHSALKEPNSIVISRKIAEKLFGNEDPLGKTIDINDRGLDLFTSEGTAPVSWGSYTVTGVLADNGYHSHLEFDVLVSSSSLHHLYTEDKINDLSDNWSNYFRCYTYVLLKKNEDLSSLKNALEQVSETEFKNDESLKRSELIPQSLTDITPGPALGNAPTVRLPSFAYYILAILAVVVLVSACLNYINLSIARAVTRSKEIGLRKVNGAGKRDLIIQFLSESLITSFFAMFLACILLYFVKTVFLGLWLNKYLNFELQADIMVYLIYLGFSMLTGILAGLFPAIHISRFKPVTSMKNPGSTGPGRIGIRKVLTVSQFIVSLMFIITSIVIYNQFKFFIRYNYGFKSDNVLNINLQSNDFQVVKNALEKMPGVSLVGGCAYFPATGRNDNTSLTVPGSDNTVKPIDLRVDENFIHVLNIPLVAGRNLPPDGTGDKSSILLNEKAAKALGYENPSEIVGASFDERGDHPLRVVGVVRDFTFFLLFSGRSTGPLVMRNDPTGFNFITMKVGQADQSKLITRIEHTWKKIDPVHPLKYEFYDDRLSENNQPILDIFSIIGFIAFLSITIACLGLLGMAMYTTERRTKEIGIRKVLGANGLIAAYLLAREFLIMLGIAIGIAIPLSYFFNNFWLEFLVAHAPFGLRTLLTGTLVLLILGLLSVVPQAFRVSARNPVDSLRIE